MLYFSTARTSRNPSVFFGLLLIVAFALTACGSSSNSPESVAKGFMEAMSEGRTDDVIEYISWKDVKEDEMKMAKSKIQAMVGMASAEMKEKTGGIDSMKATVEKEEGDTAQVSLEVKYKNGDTKTEQVNLVKDSGKWKIKL